LNGFKNVGNTAGLSEGGINVEGVIKPLELAEKYLGEGLDLAEAVLIRMTVHFAAAAAVADVVLVGIEGAYDDCYLDKNAGKCGKTELQQFLGGDDENKFVCIVIYCKMLTSCCLLCDIDAAVLILTVSVQLIISIHGNQLFCFDSFLETFFYANSSGIFQLAEESKVILEWPGRFQDKNIISFEFISDEFRLCAIFDCGAALLVDFNSQEAETFNLNINNILGASWAPDFHSLVVNTENSIAFFTREFELINQDELFPTKSGKEELVTLGWGSEETQFQGSAGRRKLQEKRIEKETTVLDYDEKRTEYCWSGDAKFFILSCVNMDSNVRKFYVWNDEGELISRLDTLECAGSPVAFKADGSLIAINRVLNGNHEVVLFERNGQKRSQFLLLCDSNCHVTWLRWNADGSLLAICVSSSLNTREVQFWYRSNYKWMLKYCSRITEALLYLSWDCEKPLTFYYLTTSGDMVTMNFELVYDIYDMNVVFFCEPKKVCFTDLFKGSLPPPMAHYEHGFSCVVSDVAISDFGAAFLHPNQKVSLFKKDEGKFVYDSEYPLDSVLPSSSICYNLRYKEENVLTMLVCCKEDVINYRVLEVQLEEKVICHTLFQSEVPLLWHESIDEGILVQTSSNDWLIAKKSSDGSVVQNECSWMSFKPNGSEKLILFQKSVFALTRDNVLLYNGIEFCSNVGSYSVDEEYIIFLLLPSSDITSRLYIVNVNEIKKMTLPYTPVGGRVVERGAMIIGHERDGTRVWLQMPRGNLETIHLRYLVLKKVHKCFSMQNYREAVVLMRKQRIDMNLIFDRDPQEFLNGVPQFIRSVDDPDLLNLFILNLNAEDTTKTVYAQYFSSKSMEESGFVDKVNVICTAMKNFFLELPLDDLIVFFTCLLSTYVKMEPRKLSDALIAIQFYSQKVGNSEEMMRRWLDYLTILVPNENLFKAALCVYNLDLAVIVAKNSQMDPKEYSAIISEFRSIESSSYQRFCIDVWLERYELAVEDIAEVPERLDEAKSFIQQRQLYSKALEVFSGKTGYNDICSLCAKHLLDQHLYEEAQLLYTSVGQFDAALHCAESLGDWRSFITLFENTNLTDSYRTAKLMEMADVLERKEKYSECADLLLYLGREV
uniref:Elongator complex protein 1 n=1 Tax=Syphacia muris TaxID=451379 RepID=A0A0N5AFL1_9BILA